MNTIIDKISIKIKDATGVLILSSSSLINFTFVLLFTILTDAILTDENNIIFKIAKNATIIIVTLHKV
jgi:hypothetical protein